MAAPSNIKGCLPSACVIASVFLDASIAERSRDAWKLSVPLRHRKHERRHIPALADQREVCCGSSGAPFAHALRIAPETELESLAACGASAQRCC